MIEIVYKIKNSYNKLSSSDPRQTGRKATGANAGELMYKYVASLYGNIQRLEDNETFNKN